ncbi:MAG: CCA tRNA nucleotidyltransferase [Hyphomicrobiaceae bacterium]
MLETDDRSVTTLPPRLGDAGWLVRPETRAVFDALAAGGYEARAVGGAVRNALLGLPPGDVDLATPARPEDVMRLAAAAGLGTVPTGLAHGTVTVLSGGIPFEVTTLRRDVETDGRHAAVAFTDDWKADACRRDFTVNALYVDAEGTIFDPVGGYADLLARRIRFIGDARTRIREDFLRILRFFRFDAQLGTGPLDAAGLAACVAERGGLGRLSGERIRQELVKLLAAPRAVAAVEAMFDYGLLTEILPVVPRLSWLSHLAAIETALDRAPDPIVRLAALGVAAAEDVERTAYRLRLANAERATLALAARGGGQPSPALDDKAAKALLYRLGPKAWRTSCLLAWARTRAAPDSHAWQTLLTLPERWPPPLFPLRGADVLALGVAPGPRVGDILRALETWWIEAGMPPDGPDLRRRLWQESAIGKR